MQKQKGKKKEKMKPETDGRRRKGDAGGVCDVVEEERGGDR